MREDPPSFFHKYHYYLQMWEEPLGTRMDELKLRRMKKCAERPEGHDFGHPVEHIVTCSNCGLTLEELEHILGAEQ